MEAGVDIYAQSHSAALASRGIPPLMHSFSVGSPGGGGNTAVGNTSMLSPHGQTVYSSEDTVESVIGNSTLEVYHSYQKSVIAEALFVLCQLHC
jgi:hypothetical protein